MPTIATTDTAALCARTPLVQVSDSRGLTVRILQYNRSEANQSADECMTQHRFTAAGHLLSSIDPRLLAARQLDDTILPNFRYVSSLSGRPLHTLSQDAGPHVTVHDVEGALVWKKNGRHQVRRWTYDALHRPTELLEQNEFGAIHVGERFIYGEAESQAPVSNARGQLVRHYDAAGLNETPDFSTSGNALRSARRLLSDPMASGDWVGNEPQWQASLEATPYESHAGYNALGMAERSVDAMGNAQRQIYDLASRLAGSSLTLKGQTAETILREITYSARARCSARSPATGSLPATHTSLKPCA